VAVVQALAREGIGGLPRHTFGSRSGRVAGGPASPVMIIRERGLKLQLFNFQWLARPAARSLFLLFTHSSRR
jgi:hypothetical protein